MTKLERSPVATIGERAKIDRRRDMASVAVDTAGAGTFGLRVDISYLGQDVAEALSQRLYAEAAATEFNW